MTDPTEYHLSMADYFELREYRKAKEEDRLMVLPVPLGETVYQVVKTDRRHTARPCSKPVYHVRITTVTWNNLRHVVKDYGKTVFTDHREALDAMNRFKKGATDNDKCPMCADFCPVPYEPGVCRYEDRDGAEGGSDNG